MKLKQTTCKRCGRPITTSIKSITQADNLKKKYDRICPNCITPEERHEIFLGVLKQMTGGDNG